MTQFTIKHFTKTLTLSIVLVALSFITKAQNQKIKVYFNHPVNSAMSSGTVPYYTQYFQDTVAKLINNAKHTVDIAQYDYTSSSGGLVSTIATACNAAVTRGVVVRWIYDGNAPNSGISLLSSGVQKLSSPTTGMASGYIMHNKFVVIDANSTTAADANISTSSFDWSSSMATSDYNNMVVIQDQTLAQAYDSQFNQMWGGHFSTNKTASTVNSFTVNGTPIQVYFSPLDGASSQLTNLVNSANHELYFGIYTFTTSNVANAMQNKYTSGVIGFGIMDQFSTTGSNTPYLTLNQSTVLGPTNLKVYSGSAIYHNKMICADPNYPSSDPQVGCGSYNWTSTGSIISDENFMVIHDATVANEYWQSLCADFHSLGGAACVAQLGIEKYNNNLNVSIYPNPIYNQLTIKLPVVVNKVSVLFTDVLGKEVMTLNNLSGSEISISDINLPPGVYVVKIVADGKTQIVKVIKQ